MDRAPPHGPAAYSDGVRWDDLFADLEAQLEAVGRATWEADVAELARAERARVTLAERVAAHRDPIVVELAGGLRRTGRVADAGPDWLLLVDDGPDAVVPLAAVRGLVGLGHRAAGPAPGRVRPLGLTAVLRALVRRRVPVRLLLDQAPDATGTLDAVLADHLELAVHDPDVPRRASAVVGVRVVPLAALRAVLVLEV